MSQHRIGRRAFLSGAAVAAGALRVLGAGDRLRIGLIGAGGRGNELMRQVHQFSASLNAEVCAVCDVWRVNRERTAADVKKRFNNEVYTTSRFGDVLARDAIDAVIIATPDFSHSPMLKAAAEAGKDAYVEKPICFEIDEARAARDAVRARKCVVQVGTQRRSCGWHQGAAAVIAGGVLGKITRVTSAVHFNDGPRWLRGYGDCKAQDVDWDAYLSNRPSRPFDARLLRRWHLFRECTNGIAGLWMSHLVDACAMVMDDPFPQAAVCHGGVFHWKEDRETCDTYHALLTFPKGFLFDFSMSLANSHGSFFTANGFNGTLDMNTWTLSGAGGAGPQRIAASEKITPLGDTHHMKNFLECVFDRKKPNADIEVGWQHAVACVMAARALTSGQRQVYDPVAEQIRPG